MNETSTGGTPSSGPRIPGSTYRLQLNSEFTFRDALEITEYLHQLGITDCYASPIFTARPGSSHGYDVCNCGELNPMIGTCEEFERWSARLRSLGMGLLLDIVPNHMAADPLNPWWRDVLQNGLSSRFARWFDIDWQSPTPGLKGKLLLAILEDHYWKMLEEGKLKIVLWEDGFALGYHQHRFPLSPQSLSLLREKILRTCQQDQLEDRNALQEALKSLTSQNADPTAQGKLGVQSFRVSKPRAWNLLQRALQRINGVVGAPRSFDSLNALLQQQNYRLASWRASNEQLNYRRFFDVSELVALRMELPEVFEATHELVLRLIHQGKVSGLRIDHPDGLWNPRQYFARLQQACCERATPGKPSVPAPRAVEVLNDDQRPGQHSTKPDPLPLYVVAEKILTGQETLPPDWDIAGTTGYDFLNLLNGLFVNGSNCAALDELYREFTGKEHDFGMLVYTAKLKILQSSMRGDLCGLSRLLQSIAASTRYGMDFSPSELESALSSIVAAFPVYRTYITEQSLAPGPEERAVVEQAIQSAKAITRPRDPDVFALIQSLLLLSPPADLDEAGSQACRQFVMRFQQLTGPVMAKGLEDTAFYNFNRLISLNEVGGSPERFGTDLGLFHQQNRCRAEHWPHSLLATATHDTKRGEDLRARLNVLSEMPEEWRQAVLKWRRLNIEHKTVLNGQEAPDANDEYLLYQALVGAWTSEAENGDSSSRFRQRISAYMLKASREAKAHTSWTQPDPAYEQATQHFIEQVLTHSGANQFLDDFMLFHRKVAFFGLFNSLAQVVLKMAAPGVPDFYQGTELWDYSLVDPDNRHLVDYPTRKSLLGDLCARVQENQADLAAYLKALLKNHQTGQIKLYLIWRILQFRKDHRHLLDEGDYLPILATGPKQDHLCAFARTSSAQSVITVAARWVLGLARGAGRGALEPDVWLDTALPVPGGKPGDLYQNVLTQQAVALSPDGRGLPVREILTLLPVAVLERLNNSREA